MTVADYIESMRNCLNYLTEFVDKADALEENYHNFIRYVRDKQIIENRHKFKSLLYMISYFSNNHKRSSPFFSKIEKTILFFKRDIARVFTNLEIFNIFKRNKRLLLFLFEEGLVKVDHIIYSKISNDPTLTNNHYIEYFILELQKYISPEILSKINIDMETFQRKRKIGENDHFICQLIQTDNVDEFVKYTRRNRVDLNSKIEDSIFETNDCLIGRQPKIIEYACFFGSYQIVKFLLNCYSESTKYLWNYAVHGRNMELIHLLERAKIMPKDESVIIESIKSFHNEMTYYINNQFTKNEDNGPAFLFYGIKYFNFTFIRNRYISPSIFNDACKYDHYIIVENLLSTRNIDVNYLKISEFFCFE